MKLSTFTVALAAALLPGAAAGRDKKLEKGDPRRLPGMLNRDFAFLTSIIITNDSI
jgi:hypothetical protein